jgi:hypothetical protein
LGEGQGEGAALQGDPLPLAPSHKGREEKSYFYPLMLKLMLKLPCNKPAGGIESNLERTNV